MCWIRLIKQYGCYVSLKNIIKTSFNSIYTSFIRSHQDFENITYEQEQEHELGFGPLQNRRLYRKFLLRTFIKFSKLRRLDTYSTLFVLPKERILQTFRNNRICSELASFLRNLQILRVNYSGIHKIQKVKFSGYCFCLHTNI